MMTKLKKLVVGCWLLVTVIVLAATLRLWGLSFNPPHLTNDEAALGYNAYSILKTGRDEHGEFLPVIFKSFGDWKPGLYIYLAVPFVAVLGLTELSVRLPAAISGILAVWIMYLVARLLFKEKNFKLFNSEVSFGEIAAFFLAISPWHLQFSRGAWEAGLAFTIVLAGIYFFLKVPENKKYLFVSVFLFSLTLWAYQGAKLSTFIVALGLLIIFKDNIFKLPKKFLIGVVFIGIVVATPVVLSVLQDKTGRLEIYSIFSYERSEATVQEILRQNDEEYPSWQYGLYHSEKLNFLRGILGRWFNHYSGKFLFFEGDWTSLRHSVPNSGVLLLLDGILLLVGLLYLSRLGAKKEVFFIWYLLLLAPLPAALSRDAVHSVRSINMVIPLILVLSLGAVSLIERLKNFRHSRLLYALCFMLYALNYIYYLDQYWVHAPKVSSQEWHYGYKQIVEKVTKVQSKYPEVVIKQDYSQPYIFFLFYQRYPPEKYQEISKEVFIPNILGDVGLVSKLDNITFREINWSGDRGMSGKLFIVDPIKVPVEDSQNPEEFNVVDEVKYLNGQTAFRFIEIQ